MSAAARPRVPRDAALRAESSLQLAPRVSAIVLNYQAEAEADTVACIRSLQASDYPALDIILVDNGSPAEVADRLARTFPDVTVIRTGANLGFTGGNNRGIAFALARGCEFVLLLNNDTVVEPDCVSRLVGAASPGVGCVGAKILYHDQPDRIWYAGGRFSALRGVGVHVGMGDLDVRPEGGDPEEVTFVTGCCMLLSSQALAEVKGFEEDFFAYVEDTDLSLRIREVGYRLVYQPAARLYHRVPLVEPPTPPHKIVWRDRNRRRMMRRRFGFLARSRFAVFFYSSRMVHATLFLLRRDWPRLNALWKGATLP